MWFETGLSLTCYMSHLECVWSTLTIGFGMFYMSIGRPNLLFDSTKFVNWKFGILLRLCVYFLKIWLLVKCSEAGSDSWWGMGNICHVFQAFQNVMMCSDSWWGMCNLCHVYKLFPIKGQIRKSVLSRTESALICFKFSAFGGPPSCTRCVYWKS